MALTKTTDHAARALARLAQQFKGKPKIAAVLDALNAQTQAAEDALYQLFSERAIDTAAGAQLDVLGRILGQPRESATDPEYRVRLRARMIARRSSGTIPEILAVFRALLPTADLELTPGYPAGFSLTVGGVAIPSSLVALYAAFLKTARAAGVYAVLEWFQGTEAGTFTTALSTTLSGAHNAGDSRVVVASTEGFPDSGLLILDAGTGEEFAYTYKTPTSFEGTDTLDDPHSDGELIVLQVAMSPGLGFGDHNNAAVGGELAGVAVA
jgi:hypothetical protein